jgi:hypothetical protein
MLTSQLYADSRKMFTTLNGHTFSDPNDPKLGVYLAREIDHHYNNLSLSFYVQVCLVCVVLTARITALLLCISFDPQSFLTKRTGLTAHGMHTVGKSACHGDPHGYNLPNGTIMP